MGEDKIIETGILEGLISVADAVNLKTITFKKWEMLAEKERNPLLIICRICNLTTEEEKELAQKILSVVGGDHCINSNNKLESKKHSLWKSKVYYQYELWKADHYNYSPKEKQEIIDYFTLEIERYTAEAVTEAILGSKNRR